MTAPHSNPQLVVRLPVLLSVEISGYQLYPGPAGEGLSHQFRPGVTVVCGINGLGKTTFLHALYRALTGPVDTGIRPSSGDFGSQSARLLQWSTSSYFKSRVENEAQGAAITLVVAIGERRIRIRRSLRDLTLTAFALDDSAQAIDEETYRSIIVDLTGFARFEDFLVCLQYLLFVTEDRPALVWDATAQFEILRMLVGDASRARDLREFFDRIQRADSSRRNLRVQYNRVAAQLEQARARQKSTAIVRGEVQALEEQLSILDSTIESRTPELAQLDAERHRLRERSAQATRELDEMSRRSASEELRFIRTLIPDAASAASLVFLRSDGGCLVCGDRSGRAADRLRTQLDALRCPYCDSGLTKTSSEGRDHLEDHEILRSSYADVDNARATVAAIGADLSASTEGYETLSKELDRLRESRDALRDKLRVQAAQLPPSADSMQAMDMTASGMQQRLREFEQEQSDAENQFERRIVSFRADVESLQERLRARFADYASAFLAEDCSLIYAAEERRIGQEGRQFSFPRFGIYMTTALSHTEGRRRMTANEVSESQREFIDLAFRMALIDVAADGGSASLILETPEASLDSIFMSRAGRLLCEFAGHGTGEGNRLIATSNLTDGKMIAALLGAIGPDGTTAHARAQPHFVPVAERPSRIINLLEIAAPSRAVRNFHAEYSAAFQRAVYPDVPPSAAVTPTAG